MSTLRTNALEGVDAKNSITIVAGAGNITTTNVQEGLVKVWCQYDAPDAAINDSFNTASLTDGGTGDYKPNYTNVLSNTNYGITIGQKSLFATTAIVSFYAESDSLKTTALCNISSFKTGDGSNQDPGEVSLAIHGDLA
tara:strand:+ start:352 stop:768 length:417 start_codon:yes stop_codon:yes gene_type:complete